MSITKEQYVADHFPDVDSGVEPCGAQILVQLRSLKVKHGLIELVQETRDFNEGNTQIARLVKMGAIAYCNRETAERWKEGVWADIGDIIIVPKHGGWRFDVPLGEGDFSKATFAIFDDVNVKVKVTGNFDSFDQIL
jgi:hypothetical protein